VETFLADLETASKEVLEAAKRGILPVKMEDRFTLTGYVAMSLVRTPAGKRYIDQAAIDNAVRSLRELMNDPVRLARYCAEQENETGQRHDPDDEV
jgi:hypothetical protein